MSTPDEIEQAKIAAIYNALQTICAGQESPHVIYAIGKLIAWGIVSVSTGGDIDRTFKLLREIVKVEMLRIPPLPEEKTGGRSDH